MTTKPKPKPRVSKAPSRSTNGVATKKAASTTTTKKTPVKKSSKATPVKKTAPKKSATASSTTAVRELNENGFIEGTDSAIIAAALVEGATTRADVNDLAEKNIKKVNGLQNRNGGDKYVPSMVSGIFNRMMATGEYEVESTWRLVKKEKPTRKRAPRK